MIAPLFCCSEYLVDSRGFVLSKRGKPLKPSINHKGYEIINVIVNGKRIGISVHKAVAMAFCSGYEIGKQVNHIDGNKRNNDYMNLEWVTAKENIYHSNHILGNCTGSDNPMARAIVGIDKKTGECKYSFNTIIEAGRYFASANTKRARHIQNVICRVLQHKPGRKTYKGCTWKYND